MSVMAALGPMTVRSSESFPRSLNLSGPTALSQVPGNQGLQVGRASVITAASHACEGCSLLHSPPFGRSPRIYDPHLQFGVLSPPTCCPDSASTASMIPPNIRWGLGT